MREMRRWREVCETQFARASGRPQWPLPVPTAAWMAEEIQAAGHRLGGHTVTTPIRGLDVAGTRCAAKLESLQSTGSFKIRGAANRMLTLSDGERSAGVVTASSGNHGIAVALLAAELGLRAEVCVPRDTDPVKLGAIRAMGAKVRTDADDFDASERQATALAAELGACFIHPFDDLKVIAGHATVGVELAAQRPDAAAVLIPLSGGGLAAGVACALRAARPDIRLIGVSPAHAPAMYRALIAGSAGPVDERPTLAGALSGGLGDRNRYSFPLVSGLLDEVWLVSENEVAAAMIWGPELLEAPVEGAGATALAALAVPAARGLGSAGPVVAVVSGGNVDAGTVERARRLAADVVDRDHPRDAQPLHP